MNRKMLAVLGVCLGLTAAAPVGAATPGVRDPANLFSADAVKQATEKLATLHRDRNIEIVVETVDSLQGKTVDQLALDKARSIQVKGVYVLIAKKEHKLSVQASKSFGAKVYDGDARTTFKNKVTAEFKKNSFDSGLAAGIDYLVQVGNDRIKGAAPAPVGKAAGQPAGRNAPQPAPGGGAGGGGGGWSILSIVVIVGIIFVVMMVIRAIAGAMRGGAAGAPGYGGGGGGGGMLGGLMAGLGGAFLGNWLYDSFMGNRAHGGESHGPTGDAGSAGYDDQYEGTSGDFGGGDDFAGGGGNFGGGGDFGGGGGDW